MTLEEFSNEFDVLYNNVTSNQAPGLNEYEKSVFLTKAQSQLLNEYFNNRVDGVGGGFDGSQRRQYDFSSIIMVDVLQEVPAEETIVKLDDRSKLFRFPPTYFLSVNEILKDERYQYSILPISYLEYQRLMLKPYNFPVKRAVWRLINSSTSEGVVVELIGNFKEDAIFTLRYIEKPAPIILDNLSNYGTDLTIDESTGPSDCSLPEETHREILERAVTLAKIAWAGGTATQAAASQKGD